MLRQTILKARQTTSKVSDTQITNRSANAENAQRMQMIMQILQLQEQKRQFDAMMRERQRQMDWGY